MRSRIAVVASVIGLSVLLVEVVLDEHDAVVRVRLGRVDACGVGVVVHGLVVLVVLVVAFVVADV